MSLAPYLSERNVVSNVNIPEVFFDHPDREVNPIPSAPQKSIFFRSTEAEYKQQVKLNGFANPGPPRREAELVTKKGKNFYEELIFEKKKSNELMREIGILQNSVKNVPSNTRTTSSRASGSSTRK